MIDVPAGTEIIYRGYLLNEPDADHPDRPEGHVVLEQAETGAIRGLGGCLPSLERVGDVRAAEEAAIQRVGLGRV